jgi:hypothetical protein
MDRIKLAGKIVIGLNIAFGHNLPKSAVDVVIEIMKEFDEEEAAQQSVKSDAHEHDFSHGLHCSVCGKAQF